MERKTNQIEKKKISLKLFQKGFTLIELLISMGVLAIMITAAIVSLLPARNQTRLKAVQAEVATTIKTIQSYALQGKITSSGKVPAGYGFKFTGNQTYIIFYCNTGECGSPALDNQVAYFSIADRGATLTAPASPADTRFFFDIPNGNCSLTGDLLMTLNLGGINKNVRVKKSGAVLEE